MSNGFHPSVEYFLQKADPYDKYKSDWSCLTFYQCLKELLKELEPELQILYISVNPADRHLFSESYIKHIKNVSGQYIAGGARNAEFFLNNDNLTLEVIFEKMIHDSNIKRSEFPAFFKYSHYVLDQMPVDYQILDMHSDFIFFISDFFITKLMDFIKNLPVQKTADKVPAVLDSGKKVSNVIHQAFTLKNYQSKLSNINELLNSLVTHNFVAAGTKLTDFRKIFNNKKPDNPIRWINGIESLAYFVKLLHLRYKLIQEMRKDIWKVTALLFVDENGHPFPNGKFRSQNKPSKVGLIEKAVEHLK